MSEQTANQPTGAPAPQPAPQPAQDPAAAPDAAALLDGSAPDVWVAPTARADLLSWVLAALWGGNPAAIKLSLEYAHPLRLALLRLLIAVFTMVVAALFFKVRLLPTRREALFLFALGLLMAAHTASGYYGHMHTSVGHASALFGANPIFAMLLAHFFIPGDRLHPRGVLGMAIVYAGVLTLFSQHFAGEGETLTGDLLMTASSFALAARQIAVARIVQRTDPVKIVFWETLVAIPFFAVAMLIVEHDVWRWHWELLIALAYPGFVLFGLGIILNTLLLRRYIPSRILATQMVIPIFGVICGWLFFNEPIGWELSVAVVLVAIGVVISPRWPLPMRTTTAPPPATEDAPPEKD